MGSVATSGEPFRATTWSTSGMVRSAFSRNRLPWLTRRTRSFLGSGTTVLQVAQNLLERRITVITNSLPVINSMASRPNITLIALGGMLRESELSFIGHLTEKSLDELNADKVIIGTRALDLEQGLTNDYLPETLTHRAILKIGRLVIVVADHTKCGTVSTASLASLTTMHTLVTDRGTEAKFLKALRTRGVNIVLA